MQLQRIRQRFQTVLEKVLGNRNVYYQPPSTINMKYPCIVYNLDNTQEYYADDIKYMQYIQFSVTLITKDPEPEVFQKLNNLPYSRFSRFYTNDGLNHFAFNILRSTHE